MKLPTFAEVRKAAVYLVTALAEALNAGLVHGSARAVVAGIIGAAGLAGVYAVPNKAKPPVPSK